MLDRRDFLKLGGATAFAALFGGCDRLRKLGVECHTLIEFEGD